MEKTQSQKQAEQTVHSQPDQALEDQDYAKLLARMKKENSIRHRYYVTASLSRADLKKLRRWLDKDAKLEVASDGNTTLITNQTAIQATKRSRELFGCDYTPPEA